MIKNKDKKRLITDIKVSDYETGEMLYEVTHYGRSDNGKDWSIVYQLTMYLLATDKSFRFSDVRVYLYLAASADFQCVFKTTQADIAKRLDLTPQAVSESIKVLKEKDLIRQSRANGVSTFFINPAYITRGKKHRELLKVYESIPSEVRAKLIENMKVAEALQNF